MSKSNYIEETLIRELKQRVMKFSDIIRLLKLEHSEQSAKQIAELLLQIKQKEILKEDIPGHFYIVKSRVEREDEKHGC